MKTILITGATDGLGKAVALDLAKDGHRLLLHGRNPKRGEALLKQIEKETGNTRLKYYNADFAELSQIKQLAKEVLEQEQELDVLINNAGLGIEASRRSSEDGNEMLWQVNYLGTYILTKLLRPLLKKSAPSRIVQVASAGQAALNFDDINQEKNWSGYQGYCQSKLAQIMLTIELADEYAKDGISMNALHPASLMPTKIVQSPIDTIPDGVKSVVKLAVNEKLANASGKYFFKRTQDKADATAYDEQARRQLMELSLKMTGV
ncbi:SDR family NAD(P)-dependent oxidoreductase [Marinifilum caeruleilacunae]|uniref:SDR family NAD(P)-dependent oxidoreductase n=1 Tax=Marinifilum caeruleilacunae TaxID=2499076 RepID=A0ABX1WQN6_9BACT|nr:SDR family NAD(P)-dependent oxidoreductase [Marinifilum caeruleilacunae]NOU58297.1 SDR family NAD(P)-dependent oxidoreductase [Marinifilum caeruleilacunae]